jgi:hypothetical protein
MSLPLRWSPRYLRESSVISFDLYILPAYLDHQWHKIDIRRTHQHRVPDRYRCRLVALWCRVRVRQRPRQGESRRLGKDAGIQCSAVDEHGSSRFGLPYCAVWHQGRSQGWGRTDACSLVQPRSSELERGRMDNFQLL